LFAAIALMFAASSCNDFLDTLPDNRTELDSDDKIRNLLVSAYPSSTYGLYASYMSDDWDDVGESFSIPYDRDASDFWHWLDDKEEANDSPKFTWDAHYRAIANANQALKAIEDLGNPSRLDALRGEAYMCRAFAHFKLVNLFCQHFTEEFGDTDMGIPYMEQPETEVNPYYDRGTVKQVYEKIDADIQRGLPLIDDTIYKVPKYHFNRLAALGFAAEFYLYYMVEGSDHLDKAIEYASAVLGNNPESMMRDVSTFDELPMVENGAPKFRDYVSTARSTNLLLIATNSAAGLLGPYSFNDRFIHSEKVARTEGIASASILWNVDPSFSQNCFYLYAYSMTVKGAPRKYLRMTVPYLFEFTDPVALTGYIHSVQIAVSGDKTLLNRAEAHVLKEDYASATADIMHWVRMRIRPAYVPNKSDAQIESDITNWYGGIAEYTSQNPTPRKAMFPGFPMNDKQKAFMNAILHLRRIEFWGEGERWFDVKRYGIPITRRVVTSLESDGTTETDVLVPRDNRRAIQIPMGVIAAGMTPNER
jgi:hypothetical protein